MGCRIRVRGRSSGPTVATDAHTIRCAVSTKAGAATARSVAMAVDATRSRRRALPSFGAMLIVLIVMLVVILVGVVVLARRGAGRASARVEARLAELDVQQQAKG